jgi:hypothetical protein
MAKYLDEENFAGEDVSVGASFGREVFETSAGVVISVGNGDALREFLEFFLDIHRE